ncbi:MAG: hypothetical protein H6Q10_1250 [Acidobacteria bacterium]|nr:hypothetical protein [Acidobacteriota bacterium]
MAGGVSISLAVMVKARALALRAAPALLAVALAAASCSRGGLARQYEYDEDIHLSLDGSATIYVNGSLPALVALRGFDLDLRPNARFDRERVNRAFSSAVTHVTRISHSRRQGRRFAHVRIEVDDIRKLPGTAAFSWLSLAFAREGDQFHYRATVGPSANRKVGDVGWKGSELVAFRLHVPSKVTYHNAGASNLRRGNILVWEQPFAARLAGEPLMMEARMAPTSILYTTLLLFAGSMLGAFSVLAAIIYWVVKRGKGRGAGGVGAAVPPAA